MKIKQNNCKDVKIITKAEFDESLAKMNRLRGKPDTGKCAVGETAIFGSAWEVDLSLENENGSPLIPEKHCTIIEFDREATWYFDDNSLLVTDGADFIEVYNEAPMAPTAEYSSYIQNEKNYTYSGATM